MNFNRFLLTPEAKAIVDEALKPLGYVFDQCPSSGAVSAVGADKVSIYASPGWTKPFSCAIQVNDEGPSSYSYEVPFVVEGGVSHYKTLTRYIKLLVEQIEKVNAVHC